MKLILFGGKGGVGKTLFIQQRTAFCRKQRENPCYLYSGTLLGDSYGQKLGDEISKVEGVENLSALEINSDKRLDEFKKKHGDAIKKLLDTATHLDEEDIESMFQLPIPGMRIDGV